MTAPKPPNESQRLAALREYHILDTEAEQAYDDIVAVVAHICDVPIATISFVDDERQWFKAKLGLEQRETSRDISFCTHAILQEEPMIVTDALQDSRFATSELVTREPRIRFYAGFPLRDAQGLALGSLCAIDRQPRKLSAAQDQAMRALARHVMALLNSRRVAAQLADALEHVKTLEGLLPICSWCKRIRDEEGYWTKVETYLLTHAGVSSTHGICPECAEKNRLEFARI